MDRLPDAATCLQIELQGVYQALDEVVDNVLRVQTDHGRQWYWASEHCTEVVRDRVALHGREIKNVLHYHDRLVNELIRLEEEPHLRYGTVEDICGTYERYLTHAQPIAREKRGAIEPERFIGVPYGAGVGTMRDGMRTLHALRNLRGCADGDALERQTFRFRAHPRHGSLDAIKHYETVIWHLNEEFGLDVAAFSPGGMGGGTGTGS